MMTVPHEMVGLERMSDYRGSTACTEYTRVHTNASILNSIFPYNLQMKQCMYVHMHYTVHVEYNSTCIIALSCNLSVIITQTANMCTSGIRYQVTLFRLGSL